MNLKNARKCVGCYCYEEWGSYPVKGYCSLGFKVTQLEENAHTGRTPKGEYWNFYCKPAELCPKPLTISKLIEANKMFNPLITA